jgi:thioredoxin reductase
MASGDVFAGMANQLGRSGAACHVEGMDSTWDCIVVGGGAAGLSAALVLGRARRRTLVVDAGNQSNLPAHGIGGLLGHDTRPPAELYAMGRDELAAYPTVEVRPGDVVAGERDDGAFVLELADGSRETARRVLLATGMDYRFRHVPGAEERWGDSVFHCPFCHGWEVRDRPLGVLDRGEAAVHRALLLRAWSDEVTVFADGPAGLEPEDAERLAAAGVAVDERTVAELRGPGSTLTAVAFADGSEGPCAGLLVPVTLHQRSALAEQLGAATGDPGPVVVDAVAVDAKYATSVPGLFAAGDAATPMPSVANAVASGHTAAAGVVQSLVVEVPSVASAAPGDRT